MKDFIKSEETFQVLHPSVFLLRSLPPFVSLYSTSSSPFGSFLSCLVITFMQRTHMHSSRWMRVFVFTVYPGETLQKKSPRKFLTTSFFMYYSASSWTVPDLAVLAVRWFLTLPQGICKFSSTFWGAYSYTWFGTARKISCPSHLKL